MLRLLSGVLSSRVRHLYSGVLSLPVSGLTPVICPWWAPVFMPTTIKKFLRCYPKSLTMHAYRDDSEVHIQFRTCIEPAPAPGRCNGLHIEHTSRMVLPRPSSWVTESADDVLIAAADIFNRLLYKTIIVISVYAGWLLFQQWLVPGHCNIVQVNEPSPLNPVSTPSTPSHKSLSDYLFPRPSATNPIPIWTATNHEMIANMFHCIESNTCAQNQTTGKQSNTILMRSWLAA